MKKIVKAIAALAATALIATTALTSCSDGGSSSNNTMLIAALLMKQQQDKAAAEAAAKQPVTNADGSVTVTNDDGSKTTTKENADGSKTETTVSADGKTTTTANTDASGNKSVVTEKKNDDGSSSTVTVLTGKDGSTSTTTVDKTVDGATVTKVESKDATGNTVVSTSEVKADGTYTSKTEITTADGQKTTTEITGTKDAEGNVTGTATVTNPDGTKTEAPYSGKDPVAPAEPSKPSDPITPVPPAEKPTTPGAIDAPSSTITDPVMTGNLFPANGETAAYADTRLLIKFDSAPAIADDAKVVIKEGETVVDTINAKNEKLHSLSMSGAMKELVVRDQLMVLEGNTLVVTAHNDSTGKYLIQPSKTYSVTVSGVTGKVGGADFDGSAAWSFTTKEIPAISEEITVGHTGTEQFYSIQGALDAIKAAGSEKHTIKLSAGNYHERNFYNGSASVTIEGPAGNNHGEGTVIYFMNNNQWNDGTRDRVNFLWQGKDLTLKNVILKSTFTRKAYGSQNADATDGRNEVLNFDSKANLVCYNSTFIGTQDTLILGNGGGRGWFYNSVVQGDVDYIWGTMDVCLFENCQLICQGGDTSASYIFASRTPTTANVTGKGFIIYNSNITIDGINGYLGRNSGSDSQAAVIYSKIKTLNDGKLNSDIWQKASTKYLEDINGEVAVGFMDYGNTVDGADVDVSKRLAKTATMSARLVNREYNGRAAILNRGYNELTQKYVDLATKWDISAYEKEFNAPEDKSGSNFYVEPVYSKNFVSGGTLQLAAAEGATYTSSDETKATVDANGLVSVVKGVSGDVTITATKDGRSDVCVLNVIAEDIPATAVAISVADASVATYGVTTATITYTPADASEKTTVLTSSDDNVLFVTDDGKLVKEYETSKDTVKVWVAGASATLTAKSKSYEAATAGTCTVASIASEKIWICAAAPLRMATDIQSGTAGLWDGLVVDSNTNTVISKKGKMSFKLADKMQTRNVSIFIPVDGASVIEFAATGAATTNLHTIGTNTTGQDFAAVEGKDYTYSYTFDGDKTKTILGNDASIPTTFAKTAGASTVDAAQRYIRMNVIGESSEYLTYIKVTKTGDFASAEFEFNKAVVNVLKGGNAELTLKGGDATFAVTDSTNAAVSGITYANGTVSVADTVKPGTYKLTATSGTKKAECSIIVKLDGADGNYNMTNEVSNFASSDSYVVTTETTTTVGTGTAGHGLAVTTSSKIDVKVAGPVKLEIKRCQYGSKANAVVKNGDTTLAELTGTMSDSKADEYETVYYNGTAATLSITFTTAGWFHGLKVTNLESFNSVTGITVSAAGSATEVAAGSTLQLAATVAPSNATVKDVVWSSSDTTKATVDATGKVTGQASGSVVITATSKENSTIKGTYNLTVTASTFDPANATVTWNFDTLVPASIASVSIQGSTNTGYVAGEVSGSSDYSIALNVDATVTNGKLQRTSNDTCGYAQFNTGTIIKIPANAGSVIKVVAYPGNYAWTVGGTAQSADENSYTVTADMVSNGYVDMVATGNKYIRSITVTGLNVESAPKAPVTFGPYTASIPTYHNKKGFIGLDGTAPATTPTGNALYMNLYADADASTNGSNAYVQGKIDIYGNAVLYVPVKGTSKVSILYKCNSGCKLNIGGTEYDSTTAVTVDIDCSSATLTDLNGIKYLAIKGVGADRTSTKSTITSISITTAE